jgi:hypothetical protein
MQLFVYVSVYSEPLKSMGTILPLFEFTAPRARPTRSPTSTANFLTPNASSMKPESDSIIATSPAPVKKSKIDAQDKKISTLINANTNLRVAVRELEREQEEGDERISKCETRLTELTDSVAKLMLNRPMESTDPAATKKNNNALNVSCSVAAVTILN